MKGGGGVCAPPERVDIPLPAVKSLLYPFLPCVLPYVCVVCCVRRLRGLDAFPNVQTLVLDSNGLLSLPMDCPWVPSLETLWLCNNDIENLDGLLCQVRCHTIQNNTMQYNAISHIWTLNVSINFYLFFNVFFHRF